MEHPLQDLREGAQLRAQDPVEEGGELRPRREAHPPGQGKGPRIQGKAGIRHRQGEGQEGKLPEEGHRHRKEGQEEGNQPDHRRKEPPEDG